MNVVEILERFDSETTECIYGRMYGNEYINYADGTKEKDKVIKIPKCHLKLKTGYFLYIWGWPEPNFNYYYFDDYGKTWSFDKEDFEYDELSPYIDE